MRWFSVVLGGAMFALIAPTLAGASSGAAPLLTALGKLPLRFEASERAAGEPERFIARGPAYHLTITPTETRVSVRQGSAPASDPPGAGLSGLPGSTSAAWSDRILRLEFVGAGTSARIAGERELSGAIRALADELNQRNNQRRRAA